MRHFSKDGFMVPVEDIANNILIPRYYDPRIEEELEFLSDTHYLVRIDELIAAGHLRHDHGRYIPKIYYGAGPVPYVRTSDLANWEIKASPKHGVPENVYEQYKEQQDVQTEDIFFVHEGTYLIGSAAMVTTYDGPLLYQHHLAKFRVLPSAPFSSYYFLAALESPAVQRQIRSKQFTADTIDSVVGRLGEVVIPYPKDATRYAEVEDAVKKAITLRAEIREKLTFAVRGIDSFLAGESGDVESVFEGRPPGKTEGPEFLGYRKGFMAFTTKDSDITNDILMPKYYDPSIEEDAKKYHALTEMATIAGLRGKNLVTLKPGDEIDSMNYGTGDIPFMRTSDLASWELKREAKQSVSEAVYTEWKQDLRAGDILLIYDGTYLVGCSILLCESDLPMLYCRGIFRVRSHDHDVLPPALLFALLNLPFVRRQMRSKQFTRDVIDTISRRIYEVALPIPKAAATKATIARRFGGLVEERNRLRVELTKVVTGLFPKFE
jgi:hypothetical protein